VSTPPEIQSYRFGRVEIDDIVYDQDVVVFPDRVRSGWQRGDGHNLAVEDLAEVLEAEPEVVIIGRGTFGRLKIPDDVRSAIAARGIELLMKRTEQACRTYNERSRRQRVVAALHLSC
jgi:hypothetical protein